MIKDERDRRRLVEVRRNADAIRDQCLRLSEFARQAWHILEPATELKWGWALDAICLHLEAVTDGRIRRLLMNVPPGSMKSLLVGVIWPAWEWGPCNKPANRFLATAHKEDLAVRDNMKCRRLIQSEWYQTLWPIALTGDQNAKKKFENAATGFREAMAFPSMTGSRGDRVILDDPHSVDDANSPTMLAADIRTFREALPTRVNNENSAIIIIMQRLNEGDVSSVAIALGYDHLCIPMRFESGGGIPSRIGWSDPRTIDGELMFPERFPEIFVDELETTLGSYAAAGQLQQRPAPRDGGMFKRSWFEIVDAVPVGCQRIRKWDLAATVASAGRDPDWTVGTLMARDPTGLFYIEDVVRFRGSAHEVEQAIRNTASLDGRSVKIVVPQDPGQAGKGQAAAMIRMLAGFEISAEIESGKKEVRAAPFAAQCEAGNVKVSRAGWNTEWFNEIEVFPFGKHDDQIDSAAGAFTALAGAGRSMTISADLLSRARQTGRRR